MIDEALLRPGRLEVQVEIGLPKVWYLLIHLFTYPKSDKHGEMCSQKPTFLSSR